MIIHFVTSETLPFSKTGGLEDVCCGLGKALAHLGQEIIIISPMYKGIYFPSFEHVATLPVTMSWRHRNADIYKTVYNGATYLFVSELYYFNRDTLYGYDDDLERFAFFQLAYIEIVRRLNMRADIVHVHDWESSMVPLLLKKNGFSCKTILTIHNPAFQGNSDPSSLLNYFNLDLSNYYDGTCRFHDYFSCLKTGIMTADKVTTVSSNHAKELLADLVSYNEIGYIINLRKDDFIGIVNGVDVDEYSPAIDGYISKNYNFKNMRTGKRICKEKLEERFNLPPIKGPSLGIVSRLTEQKGLDLLQNVIPSIIKNDMRLYVLGSGDYHYQNMIRNWSNFYPNNIIYYEGYSTELSHLIYAGTDFFLLPSKFEPCGIGQLIAKAYGSVPIVSSAGGLYDTVIPFDGNNLDKAEGFRFEYSHPEQFVEIFDLVNKMYMDKSYEVLAKNSMKADSSWNAIAPKYLKLYQSI